MDAFDPTYVCNHSDDTGRYAFNEQPRIGLWNLSRLASVITPLLDSDPEAEHVTKSVITVLNNYMPRFKETYCTLMCAKFGLQNTSNNLANIIEPFLEFMARYELDYSLTLRSLSQTPFSKELSPKTNELWRSYSSLTELPEFNKTSQEWWSGYHAILSDDPGRRDEMNKRNPRYILRNHIVQSVIVQAQKGDYTGVNEYLHILENPFDEGSLEQQEKYGRPVPLRMQGIKCSCSS